MRMMQAGRVGAVGGTGGTVLNACSGCDLVLDGLDVLVVFAILFAAIALVWFIGRWIVDRVRRRQVLQSATGARKPALACGPRTGQLGRIVAPRSEIDPLMGKPAVAFATLLVHERRAIPQAMLRDGATIGFAVELDSGERVEIPAGPCVIELPDRSVGTGGLAGYLGELDPQRIGTDDLDPFVCDRVAHVTLEVGQRVEVAGELEPIGPGTGGTYRDAPGGRWAPRGIARLRPC